MQRHQSYKFELDPNDVTTSLLKKHVGARRFVWNWALARRKEMFEKNEGKDKFSNYIEDSKFLNSLKQEQFPWMYEVSSTVPTQALIDLDKALKKFWTHRREGVGFPKFKKKGQRDSFRVVNHIYVQSRYVKFPIIGQVRMKDKNIDKRLEGRITSATVSERAGRWFVSIKTIREIDVPVQVVGDTVGVDLGIKTFVTLSDGTKIEPLKALKKSEKKLKRAQRKLSRKQKGSNNRKKQQRRLQKIHFDIANQRTNFVHEITSRLAKTKQVIVIEDLDVIGMKFHKQIRDAAFGEFRRQLEYKCSWYRSKLVIVDRFFPSSKTCSCCGYVNKNLKLSDREWTCPVCVTHHDRDINAAINLRECCTHENVPVSRRKQWKRVALPETPVESKPAAQETVQDLTLKQEASQGRRLAT